MKRRDFIMTATAAALAVATAQVAFYGCSHKPTTDPLTTPRMLSRFCDPAVLREIGVNYRKRVPAEDEKQALTRLLLMGSSGENTKTPDKAGLEELLEKKIRAEFTSDNTIILDRWIISVTEARQCALLSLT
ncbi:MAG TPA: hypothetical protein VLJ68_01520 [Chitinophagaceae bacterium]|nr:hypothetical protein [Chitinophagaceae bacterium]